jgi:putative transposase
MDRVKEIGSRLGIRPTCDAFGVPRSSYYRWQRPEEARGGPRSPRALSVEEREAVLEVLHDDGFVDLAPAAVLAKLLDCGMYLCSERTMYRILAENEEVKERRNQLRHPVYEKPELLATRPNELWSWDLTKLLGPAKWTYYYLYVIQSVCGGLDGGV